MAQNPQIQSGDVVSIIVYPADEYNREVTVQPDGKIELPLVGSFAVGGLTAKELGKLLESKYSRYVDNPKVTVATRHFAGRRIAIIGEIRQPGFYEYRDGMKMLELIAHAGGLTDTAKASRTSVMRQGAAQAFRFNFQAVLDGNLDRDIALLPGDTIFVPKTGLARRSTWLTNNIIPWLSFITAAATLVLLAKTN
jgi:polysaccharide export outer membrane protein